MAAVLLFFFAQGAALIVLKPEGALERIIPAVIIWVLCGAAMIFFKVRKIPLSEVGFKSAEKGSLKKLFFLIPLVAVALSGIIAGVDFSRGALYIAASLFYVLAIGFAEEIYFRGIICNIWQHTGKTRAILLSSALFGACHALQAIANPDIVQTILAICFAFFYGIAFAQIFLITKSIIPGIAIHAFHDFCSFVGKSVSAEENIILGAAQTAVILAFICAIHFLVLSKKKQKQ